MDALNTLRLILTGFAAVAVGMLFAGSQWRAAALLGAGVGAHAALFAWQRHLRTGHDARHCS
jgi:hypothetical protein